MNQKYCLWCGEEIDRGKPGEKWPDFCDLVCERKWLYYGINQSPSHSPSASMSPSTSPSVSVSPSYSMSPSASAEPESYEPEMSDAENAEILKRFLEHAG